MAKSELATHYVGRDPFARGEFARFAFTNTDHKHVCAWCGRAPRVLYVYLWQEDGLGARVPRLSDAQREDSRFCSLDCYRAYGS